MDVSGVCGSRLLHLQGGVDEIFSFSKQFPIILVT